MVTYLWTTTDNKYIGINGTVYNEQPTPEEVAELQQIAQGYSNDPYAYQQAFATYVAPKIGVNPDQYFAYYNLNGSCIPGVCDIIVEIAKDDTRNRPDIDRVITTDDQGRTIVKIIFYNIDGQCEECSGTGQLYTNLVYVNSDVCRFDSEGYPPSGCFNNSPQGCDYMGILITDDLERDRNDSRKYSWYQIGGFNGGAANSYVCYIFTRAVSQPRTPSGGAYDNWREGFNGYGTTWYDTVPGINNYGIWMSMRTFWSDEGIVLEHTNLAWSEPALMTDNKIFQTEWAQESDQTRNTYLAQKNPGGTPKLPSLNGFKDETNLTEGINEDAWRAAAERAGCGEWSDSAVGATYMAWSNCRNGLWDDWTIAKIKGEGGEDGTNAGRMFMIFCSAEKDVEGQMVFPERPVGGHWDIENNILTGSITGGSHLGSKDGPSYHSISWSPDNARQSSDMCTWLSTGTFNGDDGSQIGEWSEPVCITGEDGIDGTDGENREYIYARFATLDDYMCYASGYSYTEGVECDAGASAECRMMLDTCIDDAENYQQDDYIPLSGTSVYAHWQDHPEGIEPEWRVEACCLRMKEEVPDPEDPTGESTISQWGCWIGPFIWASWGEDGIDGDGVEYIFCVTTTARTQCCYVEYTGDTSVVTEWYPLDDVPAQCANNEAENDENCTTDEFAHPYIIVGDKYYYKKTEFLFPFDNMKPPVCRRDGIYCDTLPSSPDFTLYDTASDEDEKKFLYAYYQLPEFVPGDKIKDDIANDESALMELAKEFRPDDSITQIRNWLNGDSFVKGWERNWTDNPLDIGPQQPYEWVCIRKYKYGTHDTTKEWQAFSEPKLWANWAFDGTSTFTSMVFTRTNDDIGGMSLCGGTFDFPMPGATEDGTNTCVSEDGTTSIVYDPVADTSKATYLDKEYVWEDTVPVFESEQANTDNIWMSMKIFGDELTGESQGWSAPVRMSDTADFNVEWCVDYLTQEQINKIKHSSLNFGIFTEQFKDDPEEDAIHSKAERAWEDAVSAETGSRWSDKGDGAIYMATTTFRNGKWTNWTVSKVKGEKGDAGTSIQLLGSTKGVCAFNLLSPNLPSSARTALAAINAATEVGDIWGALLCGQDIDCIGENGNETGNVQFYKKTATGWVALACETYYAYEPSTEGEFIKAQESDDPSMTTATWVDMPDEVTSASTRFVHLSNDEVNEFYRLTEVPGLNVGDTIIVNNITEAYSPTQGVTGEQLRRGCCDDPNNPRCFGIENGDFYVWDGDSWSKATNLMGPASYVHVKYADDISLDGNYYRLTEPDMQTTDSWGELPGKYIGMYIDDVKGDAEGLAGDDMGPNTAVTPTVYWSAKSGPYKWTRFMGEDGLGYEYVYCLTSSDTMSFPAYMGGRPYVPKFKPNFITGSTYQADDFVPSLSNPNIPSDAWDLSDDQTYTTKPNGTYDWTDNAISPDPIRRYRWKCYRTKEKGKWGQFIGDNSTTGKLYAIFDTNCSDELLEVDFTREFLPVFVDSNDKVAELAVYTTDVLMKQAQKEFIISSISSATTPSSAATGVEVSVVGMNTTSATLTIRLTTACTAGDGFTIDFVVTGHEDGSVIEKTGKKSLTVVAMKTDVLYTIHPSLPAIHRDGAGNLVDTELTCSITKKIIGVEDLIEIDNNHLTGFLESEGLYLTWSYDNVGENTFDGSLDEYQLSQVKKQLNIRLRKAANPLTSGVLYADEQLLVYADASSLIQADIDNEQDAIPLTYEGAVDGVIFTYLVPNGSRYAIVNEKPASGTYYECVSVETNISLFYGTKKTAIMGLSAATSDAQEGASVPESPSAVAILKENNAPKVFVSCVNSEFDGVKVTEKSVTVYVLNGWENYPETLRVHLNVMCNEDGQVYSSVFSIAGVRAGSPGQHATIFNLLPESSFIVKHADGTKSPAVLYCFVQKRTGTETNEYSIESDVTTILNENHMKIIYAKDNSDAWLPYDVYNGVPTEGENGVGTNVIFELVKDTNTDGSHPIDREKVPVVSDGEPGRGIIATCRYYMLSSINDSADFSAYVAANCPIPDYGVAPNDWVMIGSYVPSEGSKEVINVNGTIPQTDLEEGSENMYLWMVEVTWYTGGNPAVYKAQPMMLSKDGIGIKDCKNYYVSAATEAYNTVLQNYNAVCADDNLAPTSRGFTEIMPTADIDAGYTIWYFTAIYYTDNTRTCLPLCVFKDGQLIKDIEVLRGMFGEANVEGKRGAYLREFLGVMGDATPLDNHHSQATESDFYNLNVKAFMNATSYWYDEKRDLNNEQKKRLMFASGISDLGGRNNSLNPPYNDNSDQIVIDDMVATLKIWESGFLECKCASIEGRIEATEGYFGGVKNIVIAEDGIVAYPVITLNTGDKAADYGGTPMFILGETGATFNGEIHATEGSQIGNLSVQNGGIRVYSEAPVVQGASNVNRAEFKITSEGVLRLFTKQWDSASGDLNTEQEITPSSIAFRRTNYNGMTEGKLQQGSLLATSTNNRAGLTATTSVGGGIITVSGDTGNTIRKNSNATLYSYRFEIHDPYYNQDIVMEDGTVSATTGFYQTSDARRKDVGGTLTNVLSTVDEIPTIYYKWKEGDENRKTYIGTLAQNLLPIYPEVVTGSEDEGYSVEYPKLSVIALAAIKELKAEVDTLKEEIRKLKEERNG